MTFREQTKKQKLEWSLWYKAQKANASCFGLIKVPAHKGLHILPCNCRRRKKGDGLEIYRARGDRHFRCNQAGCGALLK